MKDILIMLSQTTQEVFRTMMSMEIDIQSETINELTDKIHMSSMITLDGTIKGTLVFHCSNDFAQKITSTLLDDIATGSLQEVEVKDAVSELTNIIAGALKNKVSDIGHTFSLSIPKTLNWQEYLNETKSISRKNIIKFESEEEFFFLELLSEGKKEFKKAS